MPSDAASKYSNSDWRSLFALLLLHNRHFRPHLSGYSLLYRAEDRLSSCRLLVRIGGCHRAYQRSPVRFLSRPHRQSFTSPQFSLFSIILHTHISKKMREEVLAVLRGNPRVVDLVEELVTLRASVRTQVPRLKSQIVRRDTKIAAQKVSHLSCISDSFRF